jgi:hypothetical protein
MKIYTCLLVLLSNIYISFVRADEEKQHLVAPKVSSPVFMPLDQYRTPRAPTHRAERFFPLSPRLPNHTSAKKVPKVDPPPIHNDVPFLQMPEAPASNVSGTPEMTTDQAKQILSIFGQ